jgi:hypothetical protein
MCVPLVSLLPPTAFCQSTQPTTAATHTEAHLFCCFLVLAGSSVVPREEPNRKGGKADGEKNIYKTSRQICLYVCYMRIIKKAPGTKRKKK